MSRTMVLLAAHLVNPAVRHTLLAGSASTRELFNKAAQLSGTHLVNPAVRHHIGCRFRLQPLPVVEAQEHDLK